MIVVQKFGGSSVATVEKIQAVARKVVETHRSGKSVVVVVSAMGNTTDDLLELVRSVSSNPPRRELDMLLSVGERIAMAVLSTAIHELGQDAVSLTGSQCGIVTTSSHSNARIMDVRPFRVQDELEAGRIVIVAGFQGSSYKREVTTLGRGGSDTTAVALAAALDAEACEIYSDVDGVFSADPRVVLDAQKLDELDYAEMQAMARHGAKVLNAQAVEFARRKQIALYARSTHGEGVGTVIRRVDGTLESEQRRLDAFGARGVAGSKNRLFLRYSVSPSGESQSMRLLEVLSGYDIVMANGSARDGRLDIVVGTENEPEPGVLAKLLLDEFGESVTVSRDLCTASVVASGIGGHARALCEGLRVLSEAGIDVESYASEGEALTYLVRSARYEDALRTLHTRFLGGQDEATKA